MFIPNACLSKYYQITSNTVLDSAKKIPSAYTNHFEVALHFDKGRHIYHLTIDIPLRISKDLKIIKNRNSGREVDADNVVFPVSELPILAARFDFS